MREQAIVILDLSVQLEGDAQFPHRKITTRKRNPLQKRLVGRLNAIYDALEHLVDVWRSSFQCVVYVAKARLLKRRNLARRPFEHSFMSVFQGFLDIVLSISHRAILLGQLYHFILDILLDIVFVAALALIICKMNGGSISNGGPDTLTWATRDKKSQIQSTSLRAHRPGIHGRDIRY